MKSSEAYAKINAAIETEQFEISMKMEPLVEKMVTCMINSQTMSMRFTMSFFEGLPIGMVVDYLRSNGYGVTTDFSRHSPSIYVTVNP